VNFDRMRKVMAALEGQDLPGDGFFDMQHDILYLPWSEKEGVVAEALAAAGCHYVDETESWASF
jgi:hypothetical protein